MSIVSVFAASTEPVRPVFLSRSHLCEKREEKKKKGKNPREK